MRTRCPHCHQAVEIQANDSLVEIQCANCGSKFNLLANPSSTHSGRKGRKLGRFVLLEELGRGAFGSVWKARDPELDRDVAVKLPRRERMGEAEIERFLREARAAAQLKHPGIVCVHEIGREGRQIYIVSDLVDGATLADWILAKPLTLDETAQLVIEIAEALQHAHDRRVVHRDLKPANILIDGQGRPHLTDFGLAKREAGEVTMTVDGQVLGTPAYMSPEQARGEGHDVDARADIYSLGVVLYELLTGELPFRGSSQMMILQILHDEPPGPRKLRHTIPRDLETIALKCLAKDPDRRYQTAADLAADLRRWRAGEPIHARPAGVWERLNKWRRRNRTVAALTALVAALLVTVAIGSTAAAVRLKQLADRESAARQEAVRYLVRARHAEDLMLSEVSRAGALTPSARRWLEKTLEGYESVLRSKPTDPELRQELGLAHHRVGIINSCLMRHDAAERAFDNAIAELEKLSWEHQSKPDYHNHLAVIHNDLGELLRQTGQTASRAEKHYRTALALELELAKKDEKRPDWRQELARARNNLGLLLMETDRLADAEQMLREAAQGLTALVSDFSSNSAYRADLSRTLVNWGKVLRMQGKTDEARQAYNQAIRHSGDREDFSTDREHLYCTAVAHLNLGNLLLQALKRPGEAQEQYERAHQILRELQTTYPALPLYAQELANVEISRANVLALLQDHAAARRSFEDAVHHLGAVAEQIPTVFDEVAEFPSRRGIARGGLAWLAFQAGDFQEALYQVEQAIQDQSAAQKLEAENPEYRSALASHYQFLAQILEKLGRDEEAHTAKQHAEQLTVAQQGR